MARAGQEDKGMNAIFKLSIAAVRAQNFGTHKNISISRLHELDLADSMTVHFIYLNARDLYF